MFVCHLNRQKTKEYEKVRQFLFRTRGAVVVSEAQCVTHKVISSRTTQIKIR